MPLFVFKFFRKADPNEVTNLDTLTLDLSSFVSNLRFMALKDVTTKILIKIMNNDVA